MKWIHGGNGVDFTETGVIRSFPSTNGFGNVLMRGNGITIEVWVKPSDTIQGGPARILSYSFDPWLRNFTLGQEGSDLLLRLRTTKTNLDGSNPEFLVENIFAHNKMSHVVVSYDFKQLTVHQNGTLRLRSLSPGGNFDNWDLTYPLLIGNENTGNRPWRGFVYLVAFYNRCLSIEEIKRNYRAGSTIGPYGGRETERVRKGLIALYPFREGNGDIIQEFSSARIGPSLFIPKEVIIPTTTTGSYTKFLSLDFTPGFILRLKDILLNIAGFVPFGFFLHRTARRPDNSIRPIMVVTILLAGAIFSIFMESLQYYVRGRSSDLYDVISNTIGVFVGVLTEKFVPN
ncbi:MAG: VanZ family protein [Deltaproteobacteria bacterium]|nr:VanZ family protein [Deltaproteobacteria bacterium]